MAQLTPQEQQEILRFIEAGKPLPDKYRFLLFEDKQQVELLWNGKNNEISNVVLPFQTIELVDEPRSEKPKHLQQSLFDLDDRGRQLKGWTNKLIWGDNKLILSSLKNGPLREEIEKQGGIKLIYIDPPFDVGADFSMDIEIGDDTFTKKPNILEEIAFRDTWGRGQDSFLTMIYERLIVMRDLLADDGSLYVHCDWRLTGQLRLVLDEVFGKENFVNEIIWQGVPGGSMSKGKFIKTHDTILFYRKNRDNYVWNIQYTEMGEAARAHYRNEDENGIYRWASVVAPGKRGYVYDLGFGETLPSNGYRMPISTAKEMLEKGLLKVEKGKVPVMKRYLQNDGEVPAKDVWTEIKALQNNENLDYPTQKPEKLLERIIASASNEGDIVADFFTGSGTTPAVAEKLGRKWIASDLGKFSIHTTRKRMISVQREMKEAGKNFRAFEILNLGKYQRQHYIAVNDNLREVSKLRQREEREIEFVNLILSAYKAEKASGFRVFQGKKNGRLVAVGPVNIPISRLFVEEAILEAREKRITKVDILGFEFEMGLFPNVLEEAKGKGIDIVPKHIPAEVFDKRAIERNQVVFHDVAAIEVRPVVTKNKVSVELTDFSVFYSQDALNSIEENMKDKSSKVIVDKGQIVKVSKDKDGLITRETLTKHWTDWIDYWSVDYNFESKREIVRIQNDVTKEWEEVWTGDYIFENEWQSFRTNKDRSLELKSIENEVEKGRRKIAIKVVDIFGNDTMTIIDVNIEGKR